MSEVDFQNGLICGLATRGLPDKPGGIRSPALMNLEYRADLIKRIDLSGFLVTASTEFNNSTYAAAKVIDNNATTNWRSGVGENREEFLSVDLERPRRLFGFGWLDGINALQSMMATNYIFEASNDNSTWVFVQQGQLNGYYASRTAYQKYQLPFPLEPYRYYRIRVWKNYSFTQMTCAEFILLEWNDWI